MQGKCFPSLVTWDLSKRKHLPHQSLFIPSIADPFFERLYVLESKQNITNIVSPVNLGGKKICQLISSYNSLYRPLISYYNSSLIFEKKKMDSGNVKIFSNSKYSKDSFIAVAPIMILSKCMNMVNFNKFELEHQTNQCS